MSRAKKDGKYLNIKIRTDIYNTLEAYCEEVGQTKTIAVERILDYYFKNKKVSPLYLDSIKNK